MVMAPLLVLMLLIQPKVMHGMRLAWPMEALIAKMRQACVMVVLRAACISLICVTLLVTKSVHFCAWVNVGI
jgi:hypothetical protein